MERPDLSDIPDDVIAYIEWLEMELLQRKTAPKSRSTDSSSSPEPDEPPTTLNLITISQNGMAKRTPRHLYGRQRRSGMGVFDLEVLEDDPPAVLVVVDESGTLLLFTNQGRAFRVTVSNLPESEVRSRGRLITEGLTMRQGEQVIAALPSEGGDYVAMVSQRGWVRRVRANYLGSNMLQGNTFHNVKEGGYLTAVCWAPADAELFIATRQGRGIRFAGKQVPTRGCRGLRVDPDDEAMLITAVYEDSGVFLAGHDGKGTIRLMSGFRANKAPGAGGKIAIKTDKLVGGMTVDDTDDVFIISEQSKIIRFQANEVPPKTGTVQGVNCMSLRADEATAVTVGQRVSE